MVGENEQPCARFCREGTIFAYCKAAESSALPELCVPADCQSTTQQIENLRYVSGLDAARQCGGREKSAFPVRGPTVSVGDEQVLSALTAFCE
jgi:hypothetical protein